MRDVRICTHICKLSLPDSLLHANMQTSILCTPGILPAPHPRPQLLLLPSSLSRLPIPSTQGGGQIRGGLEEEKVSETKRTKNKKRATYSFNTESLFKHTCHLALVSCHLNGEGGEVGSQGLCL